VSAREVERVASAGVPTDPSRWMYMAGFLPGCPSCGMFLDRTKPIIEMDPSYLRFSCRWCGWPPKGGARVIS
jgi:hypothetical protein